MMFFDKTRTFSPKFGKIKFLPSTDYDYEANGKFGSISVREFDGGDFTVYYIYLNLKAPLEISTSSRQHRVWLTTPIGIQPLHYQILHNDEKLTRGRFNLFYNPQAKGSYQFKAGMASLFSISIDPGFLLKWSNLHSLLSTLLKNVEESRAAMLAATHPRAPHQAAELLQNLFSDAMELVEIHRYSRVVELLRLYLVQSAKDEVSNSQAAGRERNELKLILAKEYILANLKNPGTLRGIGTAVGLHYKKLTEGFRKKFGVSVGEFINDAKMKEAHRLLAQKETVQNVSHKLGYGSPSNFTVMFKKSFGFVPSQVRNGERLAKPRARLRG